MRGLALGLGLGLLGLGTLGLGALAYGPADQPPQDLPLRPGKTSPPTLSPDEKADGLLGLNNPIAVPRRILERKQPGLEEITTWVRADAAATAALGVRWARAHSACWPFFNHLENQEQGFAPLDLWVTVTQEQGLEALVMLSPWPGDHTGNYTSSYLPPIEANYTAWVRAVVERYDGDGVDDMPGLLRPIRHWEVDNEPDVKNSSLPRGNKRDYDPQTFCTPEEYAHVLSITSKAVHEADPGAVVMNGGFFRPHVPRGERYMREVMEIREAKDAIDVLALHVYSNDPRLEDLRRALDNARALGLNKPIWLTEISVPSEGDDAWLSEAWQADMVPRILAVAVEEGVERLFWHTLADPPRAVTSRMGKNEPNRFWFHSLGRMLADNAGFELKPAGVAWRALAQRLALVPRSQLSADPSHLFIGQDLVLLSGTETLDWTPSQVIRLKDGSLLTLDAQGAVLSADEGALLLLR